MHTSGCAGHGHTVPSQVWYGQDRCVRSGNTATAGDLCGESRTGACHVPHTRVGLPDQQGVRALLQVHAPDQGEL